MHGCQYSQVLHTSETAYMAGITVELGTSGETCANICFSTGAHGAFRGGSTHHFFVQTPRLVQGSTWNFGKFLRVGQSSKRRKTLLRRSVKRTRRYLRFKVYLYTVTRLTHEWSCTLLVLTLACLRRNYSVRSLANVHV